VFERAIQLESPLIGQSIISWIGAVVNAALIYLFRPTHHLAQQAQTPNPNVPPYPGSAHFSQIISTYSDSPTIQTILPTLVPLALVALAASHGFIILRWAVEAAVERVVWRGSKEEIEVQKLRAKSDKGLKERLAALGKKSGGEGLRGGFWNGGEEGGREIGRAVKVE
jgi:anoctamin-10